MARTPPHVIDALATRAEPGLNTMTGPRFFGWVIGAVASSRCRGRLADQRLGPELRQSPRHARRLRCRSGGCADGSSICWICRANARSASSPARPWPTWSASPPRAARCSRRQGWDVEADGLFGAPPINVIIGDDAHTSVFFGAACARPRLQARDADRDRRTRPHARSRSGSVTEVRSRAQPSSSPKPASSTPAISIRSTRSFRLPAKNAWVHVDGAFGLWARAVPRAASSGPHGLEARRLLGDRRPQMAADALRLRLCHHPPSRRPSPCHDHAAASYLPPEAEGERDPSHYVPELSRRARGFATWAIIKHLGREGHCGHGRPALRAGAAASPSAWPTSPACAS